MKILKQLGIVFSFGIIGEIISYYLPFSFPSSVIGLILMFTAIKTGLIKYESIKEVAGFLSLNMAFFFLPSAVKIMQVYPVIKEILIPILIIGIVSIVFTFLATYAVTSFMQKIIERKK